MFRTSNSPSSGAFLCCMLQFGTSRYVMRVKEELLAQHVSDFNSPSSGAFLCWMLRFGMSRYVLLWGWRKNCSSSFTLLLDYRFTAKWYTVHTVSNLSLRYWHILLCWFLFKKWEGHKTYVLRKYLLSLKVFRDQKMFGKQCSRWLNGSS